MTERPKHPKKDLEVVLRWGEAQGWRVVRAKGYYKMYCPCSERHKKTVHLSPSNPRYRRNLLQFLRRETCWREVRQR